MKSVLISFFILTVTSFANAAQINEGRFNPETNKVELNVSYGGGCSQHSFKLELAGSCRELFPIQCGLNLVHTTDKPDFCDLHITEDLELDLPEPMLTDSYYEGASITVLGAGNTKVSFQLPQ